MTFEEEKELYKKLSQIAKDSNVPIITGVQMRRPWGTHYDYGRDLRRGHFLIIDYMDRLPIKRSKNT